MNIITTLSAGDSANWHDDPWLDKITRTPMTSADWTLTYQLRGPSQLSLTAVADSDGWRTSISTIGSAALVPGAYAWVAYLSKTAERVTIGTGRLVIVADLTTVVTPLEARSQAERALADCEAALASFKSSNGKVASYTIGGRQTAFHSLPDLMRVRNFWQIRVNKERAALAIANGRSNPRRLLVRF